MLQRRRAVVLLGGALCLTAIAGTHLVAQDAPLIPLDQFFDNPEITAAKISPDGRTLAYLKPYEGVLNVFVRDLSANIDRRVTSDTLRPIRQYRWSADGNWIIYQQDRGGNENFHLFVVGAATFGTPNARDLTPYKGARAEIIDVPHDVPDEIVITLNKRDPSAFDAYWVNLETGALRPLAENTGQLTDYFIDRDRLHQLRVAMGHDSVGSTQIFVRPTERDPWHPVATYPADEHVAPIRMHPDGRHLYLRSDHGRTNVAALVLLDLRSGRDSVVETDPVRQVDFGTPLFSDVTDSLLATTYDGDTVRLYPRTAQMGLDLERIRRVHPGTPELLSATRDENKWIVDFISPTDPGATYLYDRKTGTSRFLFRPRPWLKTNQLAEMRPITFTARDGLTLHGYLSVPRGDVARDLPLVMLVHGGPWDRDVYGYDPEVQLLANRGYAVLQVNYRGSTGYGKAFSNAAVHQFGGAMHTDLLDGMHWLVEQGIADPKKVAIYGGSYGGYASLVGVTLTPGVFACAVDYGGPSSLVTLIRSFPTYWRPYLEATWYRFVGNPDVAADRTDMLARSPITFVDRIRVPLLVFHGANDPRVSKNESDRTVVALRNRGAKVGYYVAANEGHEFANADNRMALYRSIERFFGQCLGGRIQPSVSAFVDARIRALTVRIDTLQAAAPAP